MTQRVIHRPARGPSPDFDAAPIALIPPPTVPDAGAGFQGAMQIIMPIMGGAGSLIMIVANKNPVMLIAGGLMLVATILGAVVMFVAQRTGAGKRATDLRRRYLDYLDRIRGDLAEAADAQLELALFHHPEPAALPDLARNPVRLWERRPDHADFLVVRIGSGPAPLWSALVNPPARDPLAEPDVVTAAAVHRLVERDRMVSEMPVGLPVSGRVSICGPTATTRAVVGAALAQLLTWHSPDEVKVISCVPRHASGWLEWLKWMPHCLSADEIDGNAPARLAVSHPDELGRMLGAELSRRAGEAARPAQRHAGPGRFGPALVLVIDNVGGPAYDPFAGLPPGLRPADLGVHVLSLSDRADLELAAVDVRVTCSDHGLAVHDARPALDDPLAQERRRRAAGATEGATDRMSGAVREALTRELTAVRMIEEKTAEAPLEATLDLADLVGVADPAEFDPKATWLPRPMADFLRVPFGLGPAGERVSLDLKEPALGGMGPHGLCVGATGSGKSEVLRTLVLTLAMTHPPERLALVLVDYKGGATFAGLEDTPHCAAMISNLSEDTGLVDRLHDALFGEMKRRQQVLADAGNLPNVTEYNRRRELGDTLAVPGGQGRALPPLPNLFVVIDEFGELLTAKPDFIELFLAIGRIGRSIGVHLLLASQRLEEGRLRGLESFLSYRLGLRTFNAGESRSVLGVPDAYELPPIPGSGYLKVDTTVFQRFKAGYVSGEYRPPVTGETEITVEPIASPFPLFNDAAAYLAALAGPAEVPMVAQESLAPTVLDVAVRRLADAGQRVAQIWLPPLPAELTLDAVAGPVALDPDSGLRLAGVGSGPGTLTVSVGLLDRPAEQEQEPLVLDLAASGGHLAVLGAPQSGKSMLLRTLVLSLALTHRPGEVALYCLDLGGGALRVLAGLPHVAGVAPRMDAERVRRTVAEVAAALAERESLFGARGIDSVEVMRDRWRAGRVPELQVADVFLVIDNYPVLRADFEDLADLVQDLATRGPGYGIHLILTSGRWADLRMQLQAALGTRVEFRLNDPGDSTISRKAAGNLRTDTPGRLLIGDGLQAQVCLPVMHDLPFLGPSAERGDAGTGGDQDEAGPVERLVAAIARAWPHHRVPEIRMLPAMVEAAEVRAARDSSGGRGGIGGVVIGIDETELRPVALDFRGTDQHLMVIGDAESGKTSLLRLLVDDLTAHHSDEEAVFAVFDLRRTMLDVVPDDYLGAYAGTAATAAGMAAGVAGELRKRLPPDDVTPAQLRNRSWWRGPEIFVLADDYDLLATGGPGPLAPFLEFLPQARDLGFHLIVARRSGGAGRALFEPVLQRMREVGCSGLLLSGDRQEGQLFPGVHLSVQPPGRAMLVRRGRKPALVQLAYLPDAPTPD